MTSRPQAEFQRAPRAGWQLETESTRWIFPLEIELGFGPKNPHKSSGHSGRIVSGGTRGASIGSLGALAPQVWKGSKWQRDISWLWAWRPLCLWALQAPWPVRSLS